MALKQETIIFNRKDESGNTVMQFPITCVENVEGAASQDYVDEQVGSAKVGQMTGATADTAGTSGLVPAPAAGDQDKVLYGDGTFRNLEGMNLKTYTTVSQLGLNASTCTELDILTALPANSMIVMGVNSTNAPNLLIFQQQSVSTYGRIIIYKIQDNAYNILQYFSSGGKYQFEAAESNSSTTVTWCQVYTDGSTIPIANGGTGATTASAALANLGALPKAGGEMTGAIVATRTDGGATIANKTNDSIVRMMGGNSASTGANLDLYGGEESTLQGGFILRARNSNGFVALQGKPDGSLTWNGKDLTAGASISAYPSWWLDRGTGSDGAFAPTAATTISGIKNYTSVNIPSGVTVTVSPGVLIKCQGAFVNAGTLTAVGKGASGGAAQSCSYTATAEGNGTYNSRAGNDGSKGTNGISGGAGGASTSTSYAGGAGGGAASLGAITVNSTTAKSIVLNTGQYIWGLGSGGGSGGVYSNSSSVKSGAGGAGGGAILIVANSVNNTGTISAKGADGSASDNTSKHGGGGGGAGGTVMVLAKTYTNTGTVTAAGGSGGAGANAGASGSAGISYTKALGV